MAGRLAEREGCRGYDYPDHVARDISRVGCEIANESPSAASASSSNAYVLRRHRLLRQPGGFEGFGFAVVAAHPDDLAVSPVDQVPHRLVNGSTAFTAVASNVQHGKRRVSQRPDLTDLGVPVGEGVVQVLPPATDSLVTAIAALHDEQAGDVLHVLVHKRQNGIEIPTVPGGNDPAVALQVLLRHRPRSISRAESMRFPCGLCVCMNVAPDRWAPPSARCR